MREVKAQNPLRLLRQVGQSVWLDYIRRKLTRAGELRRLIEEDGLSGMTSNPTIFEKAISEGPEYEETFARLRARGAGVTEAYQTLVAEDIIAACDALRPVFNETGGADGFVSVEVSPLLAHDTAGAIGGGRCSFGRICRRKLLVKIAGTRGGGTAIPAMR